MIERQVKSFEFRKSCSWAHSLINYQPLNTSKMNEFNNLHLEQLYKIYSRLEQSIYSPGAKTGCVFLKLIYSFRSYFLIWQLVETGLVRRLAWAKKTVSWVHGQSCDIRFAVCQKGQPDCTYWILIYEETLLIVYKWSLDTKNYLRFFPLAKPSLI